MLKYIPRRLTAQIQELIQKYPVISLTGPRQSGKTTLLREQFPDYRYVSLEDLAMRAFAKEDPRGFLDEFNERVIIDEAQKVPELFSYIQVVVDESKKMGQYILSGSQNFLLHRHITQSLAGRVAIFRLFPFDFLELKSENILSEDWLIQAITGFYPRRYQYEIKSSDFYSNYFETYVERDVEDLVNIHSIVSFRNFVKLCADRAGSLLNYSNLAQDAGVAVNTVKSWLSILETSYITFTLYPYFKNFNKRLIKSPKLYFVDTGLLCYLLNINSAEDMIHRLPERGKIFENLMVAEQYKRIFHQNERPRMYFWRDSNGKEIDCIHETSKGLVLQEFKAGSTPNSKAIQLLNTFDDIPKEEVFRKELVYGGTDSYKRSSIFLKDWKEI